MSWADIVRQGVAAGSNAAATGATAAGMATTGASLAGPIGALGAAVVGGAANYYGAKKQADALKDAAQSAEGVNRAGSRAALELAAPQITVGTSALDMLAQIYGLERPAPVDVGGIARRINPQAGELVDAGGGFFYDQNTGEKFFQARKGGNTGQMVPVGRMEGWTPAEVPAPMNAAAPTTTPTTLNKLIEDNPGIQFIDKEGQKAIRRRNASRGRMLSGAQEKEAMRFSQDRAATNYDQMILDPLFRIAGYGSQGSAQGANVINQMTANVGNNRYDVGAARASGYGGKANAIAGVGEGVGTAIPEFYNWYRNRG